MSQSEQKIRELAYSMWEKAGRPHGDGKEFWLEAEAEINGSTRKIGGSTELPAKAAHKSPKIRR